MAILVSWHAHCIIVSTPYQLALVAELVATRSRVNIVQLITSRDMESMDKMIVLNHEILFIITLSRRSKP